MKKVLSILGVCAIAVIAMAKPARREGIVRTASDGTEKVVYLHGNEDFHYMTDADGNWLDETTLEPMSDEMKAKRQQHRQTRANVRRIRQQENGVGDEPNIAPRGLVVLVNFQDAAFSTPVDTIDSMLNGENFTRNYRYTYRETYYSNKTVSVQSKGSVRKYFEDQSYGAYSPIFDVVGPVTVSRNMKYYGQNDTWTEQDIRPEEMIKEACELADTQFGVDFTQYDNDKDGKVDFVYVIYAGYGEADGGDKNTIWPHQWNLYDYGNLKYYVDGLLLNRYACGSELSYVSKFYDGIGTICHEFSHVLGLPDLYITEELSVTHKTMGAWDVMDYGPYNNDGNTPPSYSAYERFYMGWITPRVLSEPENVTLHPLNSSKEALILCDDDSHNLVGWNPDPKTFYLLEARNKSGWDKELPGSGMLITQIRYNYNKWSNNQVNNTASSMGVDLIEADGKAPAYNNDGYIGKETDAFPRGASQYTAFTGHEITNIKRLAGENFGTITFQYRGGWTEGIEDVQRDDVPYTKVLRDGKVVIIREGNTYDILGNRL